MPNDIEDKRNLDEMSRGSEAAFEKIYKRHWGGVYRALRIMLKNEAVAEDTAQEIFVKFWINRADASKIESLKSYLKRSAINSAIDAIREAKKHAEYTKEAGYFSEVVHLEQASMEEFYDQIFHSGLDQLPARQRQIMKMSRIQNMPHKQIAEDLGVTKETVKKTIKNALKIMKEHFELKGINIHKKNI